MRGRQSVHFLLLNPNIRGNAVIKQKYMPEMKVIAWNKTNVPQTAEVYSLRSPLAAHMENNRYISRPIIIIMNTI